MPNFKLIVASFLVIALLATSTTAVFAIDYNPGVTKGQYVQYGNFVGIGPGIESFNDYGWLRIDITSVSGKEVTLLSTSQFKNGTAIPGNGTVDVWNIETGTDNGVPSTQGPIIAANLNQGDAIPPAGTYTINSTETRTYLGVSRTVNMLNVTIATPDYNTTLGYVYDKASGMLLESKSQTTVQGSPQPVTSTYSYSITETNIFGSTPTASGLSPSPTIPELSYYTAGIIAILTTITAAVFISRKNRR